MTLQIADVIVETHFDIMTIPGQKLFNQRFDHFGTFYSHTTIWYFWFFLRTHWYSVKYWYLYVPTYQRIVDLSCFQMYSE